jgi:hypothetical protein
MNKNQPDYMKSGEVKCIDCHSDAIKIIKPDDKICLKCHDNAYQKWLMTGRMILKNCLKPMMKLIVSKERSLTNNEIITDAGKLVNDISSVSQYICSNYDLISTFSLEKIKQLKKLK